MLKVVESRTSTRFFDLLGRNQSPVFFFPLFCLYFYWGGDFLRSWVWLQSCHNPSLFNSTECLRLQECVVLQNFFWGNTANVFSPNIGSPWQTKIQYHQTQIDEPMSFIGVTYWVSYKSTNDSKTATSPRLTTTWVTIHETGEEEHTVHLVRISTGWRVSYSGASVVLNLFQECQLVSASSTQSIWSQVFLCSVTYLRVFFRAQFHHLRDSLRFYCSLCHGGV